MRIRRLVPLACLIALCSCSILGEEAPEEEETFLVRFETTKGSFLVEVHPAWAPVGAARFRDLVERGYYDDCRFFRVVPGWVVQWGINGDPTVSAAWEESRIPDDPVVGSNERGTIAFAMSSEPESRTTQVYVNLSDNSKKLDGRGFAVFGEVILGMDEVIGKITSRHGEDAKQERIHEEGNAYLDAEFPGMDAILRAYIVPPGQGR